VMNNRNKQSVILGKFDFLSNPLENKHLCALCVSVVKYPG
jgi:hypothetical protein